VIVLIILIILCSILDHYHTFLEILENPKLARYTPHSVAIRLGLSSFPSALISLAGYSSNGKYYFSSCEDKKRYCKFLSVNETEKDKKKETKEKKMKKEKEERRKVDESANKKRGRDESIDPEELIGKGVKLWSSSSSCYFKKKKEK
jgi:hypothetical protein